MFIIADKITDASNQPQMATVYSYIINRKSVERVWNLVSPENHHAQAANSRLLNKLEQQKHRKSQKYLNLLPSIDFDSPQLCHTNNKINGTRLRDELLLHSSNKFIISINRNVFSPQVWQAICTAH